MILPINNVKNNINFSADSGKEENKKVLEYDLTEEEREQFNQSCEKIRQGVCRAHELMKE